MPVFRHLDKLFLFMHIPKTGGSSIEEHLRLRVGPPALLNEKYYSTDYKQRWTKTSPQHVTYSYVTDLIPENWIDMSFAVVRHPVDRVISEYNFQSTSLRQIPVGMTFREWWSEYSSLAGRLPFIHDNHLRRQSEFVGENTHIFRLEDGLDKVLSFVDEYLQKTEDDASLPHLNKGSVVNENLYDSVSLTDADLEPLLDYYKEDFDAFGYPVGFGRKRTVYLARSACKGDEYHRRAIRGRSLFLRRIYRHLVTRTNLPLTPY